jgi:hypothetical protein
LCSAEVDGVDPARIGNVVQRICVQHYEVCTLAARYGTAGYWGESEKSWVPVHRAPKVESDARPTIGIVACQKVPLCKSALAPQTRTPTRSDGEK